MGIGAAELEWARGLVGQWVPPTPLYEWPLLGEAVGARVLVKHENHTPVGAFKVRGGLVFAHRLRERHPEVRGIVTATRGNHGQSLAFAGRVVGLDVTIVVPEGNSVSKNDAIVALGAELVVHGRDYQAAREHAHTLAAERSLTAVPPYHDDLVLGVATLGAELFDAESALDTVYVPVGMGTGVCGLMAVRDLYGLTTEIVGVVAANAPATARSFEAGRVVTTDRATTFVDGVACRQPVPAVIDALRAGAARVLCVEEDDAASAMRLAFDATHNVAEPAGALALAGLFQERGRSSGRSIAVIHTGANVDAAVLEQVLAGHTPEP
jgi:threonine dehydratase